MKTASDAVRTLGDRTPNENPSISPGPMTTISQEAPGGSRQSPRMRSNGQDGLIDDAMGTRRTLARRRHHPRLLLRILTEQRLTGSYGILAYI